MITSFYVWLDLARLHLLPARYPPNSRTVVYLPVLVGIILSDS
jgi:hypothetical protein